ncbi:hypothetical protein [Rudaea sp.]|uniref:hypothetical protein n=1 Tax=Rudaea sp. TaxID=2136325 RepID=UPI00321F7F80
MALRLEDFVIVTQVERGPAFAASIFRRKYGPDARVPDFRHHVVAFWKRDDGSFVPASYVHLTDWNDIYVAGGACTDGDVLRSMSAAEQEAVTAAGGINFAITRYYVDEFAPKCDALFACCGDQRSWDVVEQFGFERVRPPHLIARWSRPLAPPRRHELIEKAAAFAPF